MPPQTDSHYPESKLVVASAVAEQRVTRRLDTAHSGVYTADSAQPVQYVLDQDRVSKSSKEREDNLYCSVGLLHVAQSAYSANQDGLCLFMQLLGHNRL
jgi:hypothetical protein